MKVEKNNLSLHISEITGRIVMPVYFHPEWNLQHQKLSASEFSRQTCDARAYEK